MEEHPELGGHCRACGAVLPPAAEWCSLCFAPTAPAAEPQLTVPAPVVVAAEDAPPGPVVAGPPVDDPVQCVSVAVLSPPPDGAMWPCLACGQPNALSESACDACGAAFLAAATHRPSLALPGIGDIFALTKAQQVGVFSGAGVLCLLFLLGVMAVLGVMI